MTREDKDSLVETLARIPITETRGSLLSALSRLLRVIDISESSIMIPTLLKDKCEFDAYEMLTLAKILKASILGQNDLVEFYMSCESSSQLKSVAQFSNYHYNQQKYSITSLNTHHHQYLNGHHNNSSSSSWGGSNSNHLQQQQQHQYTQNQYLLQSSASASASPSLRSSASESTSNSSSPSTSLARTDSLGSCCQMNQLASLQVGCQAANNGDPEATVRLLLHIEQLKTFIPQVTRIFESIIEMYKNSVDTFGHDKL